MKCYRCSYSAIASTMFLGLPCCFSCLASLMTRETWDPAPNTAARAHDDSLNCREVIHSAITGEAIRIQYSLVP